MSNISAVKVIRAASKRLLFKSERRLEANLELAADTKADAYRIGAEEAQFEIIRRLRELVAKGV